MIAINNLPFAQNICKRDIIVSMIVYSALNLINGKRYIGITTKTLNRRIINHRYADYPFSRALKKYGRESFPIEPIDTASDIQSLWERERYWIKHFDCMQPRGYNLTDGGEGGYKLSEESRRKISIVKKGSHPKHHVIYDLTGQKFGRLTVINQAPTKGKDIMWNCTCECDGKMVVRRSTSLRNGNCRSCGCLRKENSASLHRSHGYAHTPIYNLWLSIRNRCYREKNQDYQYYGAVGIKMCDRWRESFTNFLEDMGETPIGTNLSRKDRNANFSPDNCYWATIDEVCNNKRNIVWLEADGRRQTQEQWAREMGIASTAIHKALKRGTPFQQFVEAHRGRVPKR